MIDKCQNARYYKKGGIPCQAETPVDYNDYRDGRKKESFFGGFLFFKKFEFI